MHVLPRCHQTVLQLTQRVLPGADNNVVHCQHLRLAFANADMKPCIVDAQVLDTVEHLHLLVFQTRTVDPAGGFAQPVTHLGFFALQQEHLARRGMHLGLDPRHTATGFKRTVDAPFLPERFTVLAGGNALMH